MGPYIDGYLLSWLIFMPGLTVLSLLLSNGLFRAFFGSQGMPGEVWRALALSSTSLTAALAWTGMLSGFDAEHLGIQFVEHADWMPGVGLTYFVALDGISLPLVLLITTAVPVVLLASWNQVLDSLRSFVFYVLALETATLGVLLAWNLLLFHIFWQLSLVLVFFLIGTWGGRRSVRSATRFLLMTGFGSFCMGLAILILAQLNLNPLGLPNLDLVATPLNPTPGLLEAPLVPWFREAAWWQGEMGLFLGFAAAFAATIPLVPLHFWLPSAQRQTAGAGRALLAVLLLPLGPYGLIRLALPLFPNAAATAAPWMSGIAAVGILYAVLLATWQLDLVRRFAFVSIAQLSLVVMGIFSLSESGWVGAVVGTLSHGLTAAGLVLVVGFLFDRRASVQIDSFGGLARPMPVLATLLALVIASSMGLPMLSGFVGELLLLAGIAQGGVTVFIVSLVGCIGLAVLLFFSYQRMMLGPLQIPENRGLIDLDLRERVVLLILILPMLWIGLHPNPLLRRVEPSGLEMMRYMEERRTDLPAVEAGSEVTP
jgi:NADH-quinone oxidoreductase subunit M